MKKNILLALLAALLPMTGPLSAMAQTANDTINRTVMVESVYNPVLASSEKRAFLPEEKEPAVVRQAVTYADGVRDLGALTRKPFAAGTLGVTTDPAWPAMVRVGYGIGNRVDLLGIWRWDISDKDRLDVSGALEGMNGNLPYELPGDTGLWKGKRYDLDTHLGYQHKGRFTIGIDGDLERHARTFLANTTPVVPTDVFAGTWYGGSALFGGSMSDFRSDLRGTYALRLGYHQWSEREGKSILPRPAENQFDIDLLFGCPLGEKWGRFDVSAENDFLSYKNMAGFLSYYALGINPRWSLRGDSWEAVFGLNLDVQNTDARSVQVSPDCHFMLAPFGCMHLDFTVGGGRDLQTMCNLYYLSPWWKPDTQLNKAYTPLYSNLKADVRLAEGFHLGLQGGYSILQDALFASSSLASGLLTTTLTNHDAQVWTMGGDLSWDWKDRFGVKADYLYYGWSGLADNPSLLAWTPQWEVGASAQAQIVKGLYADAAFRFVQRHAVAGVRKSPVSSLDLKVDYAINNRVGVYVVGKNLLNSRYSISPDYLVQGIHALAGVTIKF